MPEIAGKKQDNPKNAAVNFDTVNSDLHLNCFISFFAIFCDKNFA